MFARVCVDSPLPHLDTLFDYAVPPAWEHPPAPGTHVRVRLAGRLVSGVVIERANTTDFGGTISHLSSAAPTPMFTQPALDLARHVATRYGGRLWDVLRLMAPTRSAAVDKRQWLSQPFDPERLPVASGRRLTGAPRAIWAPPPGAGEALPAQALAAHAIAVASTGKQCIVVMPDQRALAHLVTAFEAGGMSRWNARGGGDIGIVSDAAKPASRYGAYLAAMHGQVPIVAGLRRAVWQPLGSPGAIVMWDPEAGGFEERHAPYPHARAVAALRAEREGLELLWAAHAPSPEVMAFAAHGWAEVIEPSAAQVSAARPRIELLDARARERDGGSGRHWMPPPAWRALRTGLESGPVAVVVPRSGYVSATACARCGLWATCPECEGSLATDATGELECGVCEHRPPAWHCPDCHHGHVKAVRQGVQAIAAQVQRMTPDTPVQVSSAATGVLDDDVVQDGIVVATPGALPQVADGYAHASIVGAATALRGGLGAEYHLLRWWTGVATLVRAGGSVMLVGDPEPALASALQTWRLTSWAVREVGERRELRLPPWRRTLTLTGEPLAVAQAATQIAMPGTVDRLDGPARVTFLVERSAMEDVLGTLRQVVHGHSKEGTGPVHVRVDGPVEFDA